MKYARMSRHGASYQTLRTGVSLTPATARLLTHWRQYNFENIRPFFCQVEAIETIIWLTEAARHHKHYAKFWEHIKGANEQAVFPLEVFRRRPPMRLIPKPLS
jgi:type III restriction enzyme